MTILDEYFEALDRLVKNKPNILKKGTRISNDSVALEAGRKKGSIKKSRESFSVLLYEIEKAKLSQNERADDAKVKLESAKAEILRYRTLYEEGIAREIMLINRIYKLEAAEDKVKKSNVVRLRK